ncbi:hypothetical protein DCAR_0521112 [Daucus carota subsp. sativus]|uniref:No apical meristem-associated C-terminal domain-containing protein n=1 Tax=Daucus carota subsp. sativus TaxID=79200 RepID=A0AAF0X768_DAUCS|nr:hypothetical protein DCAR_0521112 [Daucus carota subsp. sativus]
MESFADLSNNGTYDNHPEYLPQSPLFPPIPTTQEGGSSENFSTQEDMLLMSAWLNIDLNPVHENNQTQQPYWERIAAYFHEHKQFDSDRHTNSLMHRWSSIQIAVGKFQEYYNQIDATNQSGTTEQNRVCQALELYRSIHKSSFPFMHCWNELRYSPKFASNLLKRKNKKPQHSSSLVSSPSTPDSVSFNVEDEATLELPMGRKTTEELHKITKRKVQEAEEAEDEYFKAIFVEMKESQLVARSERIKRVDELLRLERERQEFEKRKEEQEQEEKERERKKEERERKKEEREEILYEQRIMSTNTTNMDEIEAEYYSLLKSSIIKKRRSTGFQL